MKTRLTSVKYLGFTAMDRRFSNAMLPWLLREIRTTGVCEKLSIAIEDGCLKAYNGNFEPVIIHRLVDILRASHVPGRPNELFYILLNEKEALLNCYLFRTRSEAEVADLFTQMREPSSTPNSGSAVSLAVTRNASFQQAGSADHLPWATQPPPSPCNTWTNETPPGLVRSISNASALTSLSADLSPSDSHFFEVLYIGKVRISQRKVPESLIDDALNKFAQHEAQKSKQIAQRRHSLLSSAGTSVYSNESSESLEKTETSDFTNRKFNLSASTTPLEPDKNSWKSLDNINNKASEKPVNNTTVIDKDDNVNNVKYNTNNREKTKNDVDQEFDMFTKERVEKIVKKSSQVPLEPNVLILNVPKKNLGTVTEEKNEDLQNFIKETASSITQFCENSFYKNLENKESMKVNNPFLILANDKEEKELKREDPNLTNPLMNVPIATEPIENQVETQAKENFISDSQIELRKGSKIDLETSINDVTKESELERNSPTPLNFDEIKRKPVSLQSKSNEKVSPMPENKPFLRDRSASIGTLNLKTPITQLIGEQNRTMLFQVGRSELRLISPDRKQILLHRAFKDVASCVLGRLNKEHFGFVCRETAGDTYACYVFKCESDSVATELINAIKQAFVAHAELLKKSREKSPNMTCEHCPMLWYHRLCHDVEGMNEKKTHAFILRRIEQLPEDEQEIIITKYQGGTNHMYEVNEHNAFLMMLLRAHCEGKQQRHVHDTAENRSEFLNQYLGGSTIFMKAKRSLSSGFDHLLKRKASRDEGNLPQLVKKETSPLPSPLPVDNYTTSSESVENKVSSSELLTTARKSVSPANGSNEGPPSPLVPSANEDEVEETTSKEDVSPPPANSPMMDIFLKVSDSRPNQGCGGNEIDTTWRQAIYEKVLQPNEEDAVLIPKNMLNQVPHSTKRSKEELRQLWKLAIDQTLLLVRMERENERLKEREESSAVRRIKLEYTELGACDTNAALMWDSLLAGRGAQPPAKVDRHMLTQAVIQGVPRMSRGGVWYFLAEQYCLRAPPPDTRAHPHYHTPYRTLLAGLTKHQHAILIDLGRTFPKHSYFASALGPGQLALYNILKAYSLLDPEVGYCQGLSFVAGVLLLHMEEAEAFVLLRHLMFRRGLRKQYLPDMSALQVQLYQLSRLVRDHDPELHYKLEQLDISPALYAAPWMLTLFTSQFPLGFVVRVFDLIFLDSLEVVFAVSLALLTAHRSGLLMCESCEEAAEYLRHKLPDMAPHMYNSVMKKVLSLDISRQLSDYAVEYAVLREEMPRVATLSEDNRVLMADKARLSDELDTAMDTINSYQKTQTRIETLNKQMEQQLTLLSRYISAHQKQDMPPEIKKIIQNYSKKLSFSSKILKFTSNDDDDEKEDPKRNFKTRTSTPNLFAKISKEEFINSVNKERTVPRIESNRRHFLMKKSQSVQSGLIANNSIVKQYPMKILEEIDEIKKSNTTRSNMLNESHKEIGTKNSTHEQIRQERMFERQLKSDFDANLKKLDEKLEDNSYLDDVSIFQGRKAMSLNIYPRRLEKFVKLDRIDSEEAIQVDKISDNNMKSDKNVVSNTNADKSDLKPDKIDSGFVTPQSPIEKVEKDDTSSVISHPLSDIDAAIKFDSHSVKLKQFRPTRSSNVETK